jgi:hypothetical protein
MEVDILKHRHAGSKHVSLVSLGPAGMGSNHVWCADSHAMPDYPTSAPGKPSNFENLEVNATEKNPRRRYLCT